MQTLTVYILVPVAAAFAASWVSPRSLWLTRYLITVALPFVALLAFAADRNVRVARIAALTAIAWALVVSVPEAHRILPHKTEWRELTRQLTADGHSPATVYAFEGYLSMPLTYNAGLEDVPLRVATTLGTPVDSAPAWVLYRPDPTADSALFASAAQAGVTLGPPISIDERSTYFLRRVRRP